MQSGGTAAPALPVCCSTAPPAGFRADHALASIEGIIVPTTLITGASSGLGAEMARQLAARGNDLALCVRRTDRLEEVRTEIHSTGTGRRVELRDLDVNDDEAVFKVFRAFKSDFGSIDRIVVNAGISNGAPIGSGGYPRNKAIATTNFVAALAQVEAAMEIFRAQQRGHLVLISSMAAMRGMPNDQTTYAATKAGLAHLAEGIRIEMLGAKHLDSHVTTIYPGYIRSEISSTGRKPFLVDTKPGVRAMVEAMEKKSDNARVPSWPWRPLGAAMRLMPLPVLRRLY